MAKKVFIKTIEDALVHFDWGKNTSTLCGLETSGDGGLGIEQAIPTTKKVDCPDCIAVVIFCQGIKKSEFSTNS